MWFMNTVANPIVRWLLQSPLHGILSGSTLLITVKGRKSGKDYSLPVQYVQSGDFLFVIPGAPEQKTWWRNLRGGAAVQVLLRGQKRAAWAEVLTGDKGTGADCSAIADALDLYFQRFPPSARIRHIQPTADGTFHREDLHRAAASTIMVRLKLGS